MHFVNQISEAIHDYHELLKREHFNSTREILDAQAERLSVAGRPVCSVLRPYFIQEQTYDFVRNASHLVMLGVQKLCEHLKNNSQLRSVLDLSAEEEALIAIETGYGAPDVSSRLDGFLSADGDLQFVEYNADSPGGLGYGDALAETFSAMPVMKEFAKRYPFRSLPIRSFVWDVLMASYRNWGGSKAPQIAIVDWRNAPTYKEFLMFEAELKSRGCAVKILDPSELDYRDGKLRAGDFVIDLIYKRVVVGELLERCGLNHPLINAVRDRAVCCVNGFGVQMGFKKGIFALISELAQSDFFNPEVRTAIQNHVPWTRKVKEGRTNYRNAEIDLIPFVAAHRENLVLKPNGEYGGRGVVLGWETGESQWEETLQHALSLSYVVQERVVLGSEVYPSIVEGVLRFDERYFDLDPYVWEGQRVEGCGVRLSKLALLNVSAGGGSATPMFIIHSG